MDEQYPMKDYGRIQLITQQGNFAAPFNFADNGPIQAQPLLETDALDGMQQFAITVQASGALPSNATDGIAIIIDYWIGEVQFQKIRPLISQAQLRMLVSARKVRLQAKWASTAIAAPPLQLNIKASVAPGGSRLGPEFYAPLWENGPNAASDHAVMQTGSGVLINAQFSVLAVPAAGTFFIGLYDTTTSPPPANTPVIPGGTSAKIVATGASTFTEGDSQFFGSEDFLEFSNGLEYALSTTPDKYTAPAAGGQVWFQARVGF